MRRPLSDLPRVAAVLIVAGVMSLASVALPTQAAATSTAGAVTAAPEATPPPTPLVGDFDGDGRSDQLWYGPGASPDHAWYGKANRAFAGRALTVAGTYVPLVGDFSGDGRDDVLWYGPGGAGDYLWRGTGSRGFIGRPLTVGGTYTPLVGDFDGDRHEDVFWYAPTGPDQVWYGTDTGFTARAVTVSRRYDPILGDFDGNGTTDVLWYGPGSARDHLWRGTRSRTFVGASIRVGGDYTPVVADYAGDGPEDIYWHSEAGAGVLWRGRLGGGFEGASAGTAGASPPVAGDYDGDGAADLLWDNPGVDADHVWYGSAGGFSPRAIRVGGTYVAEPGDYDGDGRQDVFWFASGAAGDVLWFGEPGRSFGPRPSSLDPLPGADAPFRQDGWASQFDPFGYVAHAFGPTPPDRYGREFGYSNSLEAFEHNYARGFRVFEADLVRLADGTVLAAHNGTERRYGLPDGVSFDEANAGQLSGSYTVGGGNGGEATTFTPLFAADLVELLRAHPDAYVILDTKLDHVEVVAEFVRLTAGHAGLMNRLVPHVAAQSDLDQMRARYPIRNYVLALYRTQAFNAFDDARVARFVQDNRVPAVMMWWGQRDPALSLSANMAQQRRYTPGFVEQLEARGAVCYVHSIGNVAVIQSFTSRGVGVYSNGPFPPFSTQPAPIEPRIESGPLV